MLIVIIVAVNISAAKKQLLKEYEHINYISHISQEERYVYDDSKEFLGSHYVHLRNRNRFI